MLYTVDPTGQGELSYLELYDYCHIVVQHIYLGALIICTMDPIQFGIFYVIDKA